MKAHWKYLKYVLRHKWFVLLECSKLGVPLWIALLHDWDKFMPDEWSAYVHTFYAPDGSKQYVESVASARARMKHQHRNKHHWQYWLNAGTTPLPSTNILVGDRGTVSIITGDTMNEWHGEITVREPMPDVYRREMLADWRGAGQALGLPDIGSWYVETKDKIYLHPETREWIEGELGIERGVRS
jgi:hypothetical protein